MAQASQKDRQIRRLKIEGKRTHQLLEFALRQRDEARTITKMLTEALTKIKEQNPDIEFFKPKEEFTTPIADLTGVGNIEAGPDGQ